MRPTAGLVVALPTPFEADGRIDFDYVVRHLDYVREHGADGVLPCGTNGEGPSMSLDERKQIFRITIDNSRGMAVVAGTGCASSVETIQLTRDAEQLGADAAMVAPPFFFKNISTEGLYNYYAAVLRSTRIPIFLYNIPQMTAVEITDELVQRLLEFADLAGIKDSSGDADRTRRYIEKFPSLKIFSGDDRNIEAAARFGVTNYVSGIANALPELIRQTLDACADGGGAQIQAKTTRVVELIGKYPLYAANKCVLALRGFPYAHVRPPLVDLTPPQRAALETDLRREHLI